MFREMRRKKQEISRQDCIDVLTHAPRGVMAVHGEDGYPYAFPMNHFYLDGKLYFHCAKQGHKLDAVGADNRVSFCVMDEGFRKEGQWPLNITSVVIFGTLKKVETNEETIHIIRQLGLKHYPNAADVEEEIRQSMKNVQMLELTIDHMTGKLVNES